MNKLVGVIGGVAAGLALMYIMDPNSGARRRALLRDKVVGIKNDVIGSANKKVRHLQNKAKGMLHEARTAFGSEEAEELVGEPGRG